MSLDGFLRAELHRICVADALGGGDAEELFQRLHVVNQGGSPLVIPVVFQEHFVSPTVRADVMSLYQFVGSEALIDLERSVFSRAEEAVASFLSIERVEGFIE
jgi:hypothetical protein